MICHQINNVEAKFGRGIQVWIVSLQLTDTIGVVPSRRTGSNRFLADYLAVNIENEFGSRILVKQPQDWYFSLTFTD